MGVVDRLVRPEARGEIDAQNRATQERERTSHSASDPAASSFPYAEAFERRFRLDWAAAAIAVPSFLGMKTLDAVSRSKSLSLNRLVAVLPDLGAEGKVSPNLRPARGLVPRARELFDDARRLLEQDRHRPAAHGQCGLRFFPGEQRGRRHRGLRRPIAATPSGCGSRCSGSSGSATGSDRFARWLITSPRASRAVADYLGAFAVTAGVGVESLVEEFERDHDDYNSIMTKALADRLAEAFAEMLHRRARQEWGFGRDESLSFDDLIEEKYRGIRPASGYPSCPDHTDKPALWDLLDVENATGIRLTESYAMYPGASVSGFYFAHPEARYFAVDFISRDQVQNYAARKKTSIKEVERWLAPNLAYDPD